MNIWSTFWAFFSAFWYWFWSYPIPHIMGLGFLLGFILKPFLAAINLFRQVGQEIAGGIAFTRGQATSGTALRIISDYGSALLWTVMWLLSAVWLKAIGLDHWIPRLLVGGFGMAIYGAFLYLISGGSTLVGFGQFLDDATGYGSFLMGLFFLFKANFITETANNFITTTQSILGL